MLSNLPRPCAEEGIAFEKNPIIGPTGSRLDKGPEMTITPYCDNLYGLTLECEKATLELRELGDA